MPIDDEPISQGPISGGPISGGPSVPAPPTTAGECPARAGAGAETDLLNDALGQIGEYAITAIDDGSVNANYCQRFYPKLLDAILRAHHWKFATTRLQLPLIATGPIFEFSYAFVLPADYLKIIEYNGFNLTQSSTLNLIEPWSVPTNTFRIERRTLVTNDSSAFIGYIARITDPTRWDPLFYQVMATWLASKLALAISKDAKMALALQQSAHEQLGVAMAVDGQEGSVRPIRVLDLIWGR